MSVGGSKKNRISSWPRARFDEFRTAAEPAVQEEKQEAKVALAARVCGCFRK